MLRNRKLILSLVIGLLFSGAAIGLSFRNVPFSEVWSYVRCINPWHIVLSVALSLSTFLVRAVRWRTILAPVKRIGTSHAFHPLVIAFAINCILPGRMGELARPAILYKRDHVEFSKVLSTVVVERIFDIFTLLVLFVSVLGMVEMSPSVSLTFNGYDINRDTLFAIRTKTLLAGCVLLGSIVMLMVPVTRSLIARFISWLPHVLVFTTAHYRQRLSQLFHDRSHAILDNIALGFQVLKSPATIATCILLSAAIWVITFCSFYVIVLGSEGVSIDFIQASAVVIFICFFIMLPSVPGYWGIWEIGGIYGLMLFGVPKVEAAGITLTYHVFQVVPLILMGLFSAWFIGVNIVQTGLHSRDEIPR